jgi:transmembrane sensor
VLLRAGGELMDLPPQVAERAVQWLVELQSDGATDAVRRAWQHWRDEHPDHERAWQRIEAVNGRLQGLASPLGSAVAHAALAPPRSTRRRDAIKTLSVVLFAGGGAWVAAKQTPWREWMADERTGVGERRTVTLADGSAIALNTDTAVTARFGATERRVRLDSGEILVTTSKKPSGSAARPFVVETGHGELWPLGTRFAVRRLDGACRVDVFEGAVQIRPHDATTLSRTLQAGEQATFTRTGVGEPGAADDGAAAWTDGMIVASGMRLADFLVELGRHRPGRLGCDPAVADLRVSGTYPLADTERILDTLRTTLPVEIRFLTRYWVTVRPRKNSSAKVV